jgi:hypothetical protein|tara:strand:- start:1295 stop:2266 length:972 start_codon:yes stop_codon:yes gene_type:complete
MQIPTSAGMLANSVLPVTPTQGGLVTRVAETAGSTSFAPVEAVTSVTLSRAVPEQRAQPSTAPENSGRPDISPTQAQANKGESTGAEQNSQADDASATQAKAGNRSERSDADNESKQQERIQEQQQKQDLELIRTLSQRESEVHAHENAHSAVGGQYAGSASYTYQRGPDGVNYAVGGEVSIDASVIPGDPAATLQKMQLIQRAALAPAEPSAQDRKVAALAAQQANQARAELATQGDNEAQQDGSDTVLASDQLERSGITQNVFQSTPQATQQDSATELPADSSKAGFQVANERIARINEILVSISQSDTSKASGQLLDAVV